MKLKTLIVFATVSAFSCFSIQANEKESAGPSPSKELSGFMKNFEGKWKCQTTFPAGAFGPGSPEVKTTSSVRISKELDGYFYRGEYSAKKTKEMPGAYHGIFYFGYDTGTKQIINVSVDNTGTVGLATGPITGDTATWTGESYMMGNKVKVRESMSLKGPKEVSHQIEVDMDGKGFQMMGKDVCSR